MRINSFIVFHNGKYRQREKHPKLKSPKTHNAINLGSTLGLPEAEAEAEEVNVVFNKYNGFGFFMKGNGLYRFTTWA